MKWCVLFHETIVHNSWRKWLKTCLKRSPAYLYLFMYSCLQQVYNGGGQLRQELCASSSFCRIWCPLFGECFLLTPVHIDVPCQKLCHILSFCNSNQSGYLGSFISACSHQFTTGPSNLHSMWLMLKGFSHDQNKSKDISCGGPGSCPVVKKKCSETR